MKLVKDMAGRFSLLFSMFEYDFAIHFLLEKDHRVWGFYYEWYDGPHYGFGLGALILVCWNRIKRPKVNIYRSKVNHILSNVYLNHTNLLKYRKWDKVGSDEYGSFVGVWAKSIDIINEYKYTWRKRIKRRFRT